MSPKTRIAADGQGRRVETCAFLRMRANECFIAHLTYVDARTARERMCGAPESAADATYPIDSKAGKSVSKFVPQAL
jgi:hypothetical protein